MTNIIIRSCCLSDLKKCQKEILSDKLFLSNCYAQTDKFPSAKSKFSGSYYLMLSCSWAHHIICWDSSVSLQSKLKIVLKSVSRSNVSFQLEFVLQFTL